MGSSIKAQGSRGSVVGGEVVGGEVVGGSVVVGDVVGGEVSGGKVVAPGPGGPDGAPVADPPPPDGAAGPDLGELGAAACLAGARNRLGPRPGRFVTAGAGGAGTSTGSGGGGRGMAARAIVVVVGTADVGAEALTLRPLPSSLVIEAMTAPRPSRTSKATTAPATSSRLRSDHTVPTAANRDPVDGPGLAADDGGGSAGGGDEAKVPELMPARSPRAV